jgi:hypothetical protein
MPLSRRRGSIIRAGCVENLSCGSLNLFQALAEELRVGFGFCEAINMTLCHE